MTYALWELRSGNLMATFGSEGEALRALARAIQHYGPHYAESLALVREEPAGEMVVLGEGAVLAERALALARRDPSMAPA